ncbi:MAG: hypothetical protein WBC94_12350, partial [Xanthobacteraceae bacterium]
EPRSQLPRAGCGAVGTTAGQARADGKQAAPNFEILSRLPKFTRGAAHFRRSRPYPRYDIRNVRICPSWFGFMQPWLRRIFGAC